MTNTNKRRKTSEPENKRSGSQAMDELRAFQETYEMRFSCCICFSARLNMISGQCQHRICDGCLYLKSNERRHIMKNCPVCGLAESFPKSKPILPQEVLEVQKCLGVQECPNKCAAQMWYWEVEDHLICCPKSRKTVETPVATRNRQRQRRSDMGPVTVTRRGSRSNRKGYSLRAAAVS